MKSLDWRVVHSPRTYSLQWRWASTFSTMLGMGIWLSVLTVAGMVLGSGFSRNVTQNRYSRSRQMTGARWSPSIAALTGSQGVHMRWA